MYKSLKLNTEKLKTASDKQLNFVWKELVEDLEHCCDIVSEILMYDPHLYDENSKYFDILENKLNLVEKEMKKRNLNIND